MCIGHSFYLPDREPAIMAAGSILEDEFWDSIIYFLTLSDKIDGKWTIMKTKVCLEVSSFSYLLYKVIRIKMKQRLHTSLLSNTKAFAFLGLYYSQVYAPNRQKGCNHFVFNFEKKITLYSYYLQDGSRYVMAKENMKRTESNENTLEGADFHNVTEVLLEIKQLRFLLIIYYKKRSTGHNAHVKSSHREIAWALSAVFMTPLQ